MEDLVIVVPQQSINQETQTDPLKISLHMDKSTQVDRITSTSTGRRRSNSRQPSLSRYTHMEVSSISEETSLIKATINGALDAN